VIKVGGEWLSSLEIEDIIGAHPAVAETAVVGSYDAKWGEVPLGIIVLKPEQTITDHQMMEQVKGYIDRGLLPREAVLLRVQIVAAIEKTSVGKINKLALREKYAKKA
jgi:fatty-acyl-CoA synthase